MVLKNASRAIPTDFVTLMDLPLTLLYAARPQLVTLMVNLFGYTTKTNYRQYLTLLLLRDFI